MKTVILAGGFGTRISEETVNKPKPMIEIGGKPILWHLMNIYSTQGFNEFIIALGYKGEMIKEYFLNYHHHQSDLTINLKTGGIDIVNTNGNRSWIVHLVDTGYNVMTGGRLHRLKDRLKGETFMLTYGDSIGNVDIKKLIEFHKVNKNTATVTAVRPAARFGGINFEGNKVTEFKEKPQTGEGWINGGFFIFEPKVFDYLHGDDTVLEGDPLENLAKDRQLMAYKHEGFWHCMDTMRDKDSLEKLWAEEKAPWKIWK